MEPLVKRAIIEFEEILTPTFFKQGEIIHRQNEICNTIFIVKKGAMRSFYHIDGRDITAHFALDYNIIGAIDSIVKGTKSNYNIEVLEDSHIMQLDSIEMEHFLEKNPKFERIARQISQLLYFDLVERLEGMTFLSAKDRYNHLLKRYPTITQRVNLGHIASYLGITQETLSRIRAQK